MDRTLTSRLINNGRAHSLLPYVRLINEDHREENPACMSGLCIFWFSGMCLVVFWPLGSVADWVFAGDEVDL